MHFKILKMMINHCILGYPIFGQEPFGRSRPGPFTPIAIRWEAGPPYLVSRKMPSRRTCHRDWTRDWTARSADTLPPAQKELGVGSLMLVTASGSALDPSCVIYKAAASALWSVTSTNSRWVESTLVLPVRETIYPLVN